MNKFPAVASIGATGTYEKVDAAESDDLSAMIPVFGSLSGRIELRDELLEIAVSQVQTDFEPVFATGIGFRRGSISD